MTRISRALLRALIPTAVTAAALILGLLAGAVPASAHTTRIASDPADGAKLVSSPAQVSATFNEPLQPAFAAMTVIGPDDNVWSTGDPRVEGAIVSVALRPLGPAGRYTVNYRVTSADGHPVTGSWSFDLTARGSGTPGAPPSAPTQTGEIPAWAFAAAVIAAVAVAAVWALRRGTRG